jgi:hypothetical protein
MPATSYLVTFGSIIDPMDGRGTPPKPNSTNTTGNTSGNTNNNTNVTPPVTNQVAQTIPKEWTHIEPIFCPSSL